MKEFTAEEIRQRQNLLNALYIGFNVWKRIYDTPEYRVLQDAYGKEVFATSSATPLARELSEKMRAKKIELQDAIAQEAVNRIEALPPEIIIAVSDIIDDGKRKLGTRYRYPAFDELLQQAGAKQ
jgi:hypothetical protein